MTPKLRKKTSDKTEYKFGGLLMDFKELTRDRKIHLTEIKRLANRFLNENIALKNKHKASWEYETIENNIKQLRLIIQKANKDLEDKRLASIINTEIEQQKYLLLNSNFLGRPDILKTIKNALLSSAEFEVLKYSPNYSITYDFYWIVGGTVGEQKDVAFGKKSPDIYVKYCPSKIEEIKKNVIPYLRKKNDFKTSCKLLTEAIDSFGNRTYLVTNILLITITEGLVRELAKFVYSRQNPKTKSEAIDSYIYEKFLSLEGLINKGDWKDDIPIKITEAYILTNHINDASLNKSINLIDRHKATNEKVKTKLTEIQIIIEDISEKDYTESVKNCVNEKIKEVEELSKDLLNFEDTINISLRAKLQFLLRRYKEDRNSIIHGNYHQFDKGWKCFIYLSAVIKVFDLIKEYDKIYGHKKIW